MTFIGIDIGSSFIKGALLDLDRSRLRHIQRIPFPEPLTGLPALFHEYDPQAVVQAVSSLLKDLASAAVAEADEGKSPVEGLVLSSQMHGVVLTSAEGRPLSTLSTWQDQRGLMPHPSGKGSYFDVLSQRINPDERRQLGNELRPGLPVVLLFWLAEQGLLPSGDNLSHGKGISVGKAIPAALPDFILANLCHARPVTEITHAMSHGLLNLETQAWHSDLITRLGLGGLRWPEIVPHGAVVGQIELGGRAIPCYTPVGDYQATLLGALLRDGELSLNISTGSQVSSLRPGLEFGDFQTRPFFDGQFLACITHIPAGRSLNLLVRLLSELAEAQQVRLADPWAYISQSAGAVSDPQLQVDLAFFSSSCGDRGLIGNIHEEELTVGHLFRAAFQNMADNYYASALRLAPAEERWRAPASAQRLSPPKGTSEARGWSRLVFSGGLAQKIPALRDVICARFQAGYRLSPTSEETLLGLLALALVFSGWMKTAAEAIRLLEQENHN